MSIDEALQLAAQYQQAGQRRQAEQVYRQIVAAVPQYAEAHYFLGNLLAGEGRLAEARDCFQRAVQFRPTFPEAQCNLGNAWRELGNLAEAQEAFERALEARPDFALAHSNLASLLQGIGQEADSLDHYRRALQLDPYLAEAHNNLGSLLQSQKHLAEAQACYEQAVRLRPKLAAGHYNLGNVHKEQGHFNEAAACYRQSLQLDPQHVDALNNLGNVLHSQGQFGEALATFQQALRMRPEHVASYNNLGNLYCDLGQYAEAFDCFSRALQLKPDHAEAHLNCGNVLKRQGKLDEAIEAFGEALRHKPSFIAALCNLAGALAERGDWHQAQASYQRALATAPSDGLRIKAALSLPLIYESLDNLDRQRQRLETDVDQLMDEPLKLDDPLREVAATNFFAAYHGRNDRELQSRLAQLYLRTCPSLSYVAPHCLDCGRNRAAGPIRIGFVSQSLYSHSVGKMFGGLIRQLSRERFHVVLFRPPGQANDPMACLIDQRADELVTLPATLAPSRQRIAERQLDVLFYPDVGQDPWTYFLAFARLAPVQCVTWGHPVTTGIPTLDYFLSSSDLEPDDAQEHYTERLVQLANISTYYYPPPPAPARRRSDFGLPDGSTLYMCVQSLFKIHPDFDQHLADVLRADSRGRLLLFEGLHPHWSELLRERFRRTIPDVLDRIDILPRQSRDDFQQLLSIADVLLDTTHFSGGVTTFDGLAFGTPIVTLPGKFLRGRQTYACYRRMGVHDCIADDEANYVRLAVRLGTDRAFREHVRTKILAARELLYENTAAVREVEDLLESVVRKKD